MTQLTMRIIISDALLLITVGTIAFPFIAGGHDDIGIIGCCFLTPLYVMSMGFVVEAERAEKIKAFSPPKPKRRKRRLKRLVLRIERLLYQYEWI